MTTEETEPLPLQLARGWVAQRQYALALEQYQRAETVPPPEVWDAAVEAAHWARMRGLEAQAGNRTAEALEHLEYAHGIWEAMVPFGEDDDAPWQVVELGRVLAGIHVRRSEYNRAVPRLRRAHDVLRTLLDEDDPRTTAMASDLRTLQNLAKRGFVHKETDAEGVVHWFQQVDYALEERDDPKIDHSTTGNAMLGVSTDWIKTKFWQQVQAAKLDQNATIQQVLQTVIEPETKGKTPHIHSLDQQYTGPASILLCYANESTVANIVNTLDHYCRTQQLDDRTVFVWMECLCGLGSAAPTEKQDRIAKIGHLLAILTPWWSPLVWKQPDLIQEIVLAQRTPGCKLTLVLPPAQTVAVSDALVGDPSVPIAHLYRALEGLPTDQQGIFRPWIRNMIRAQITEHCNAAATTDQNYGSFQHFHNSSRSLQTVDAQASEEQAYNVFRLQLCNKMGLLFWQYGEYKMALELLEDALAISIDALQGQESTATVYQNIANILTDMGRYTKALEAYLCALQILEAMPQPIFRFRTANLCTKLGNLYGITNASDRALEYHQRALAIQVKLHGSSDTLAAADCHRDMGSVLFNRGDTNAALREFQIALEIQERILNPEDEAHPSLAATHNQIGTVLQVRGDYQGALKEYRRALSIQEEALGEDHVQTAMTYDNIAAALKCQDQLEGALEAGTKAKDIYETCLGHNHPTTAAAWHAMGTIQNELDLVEGALQSYYSALEIRQSALGSENILTAESLQSIGTLLFEIGDLDEALVALRKAFDVVEPLLGMEHPTTKELADTINAVLEA